MLKHRTPAAKHAIARNYLPPTRSKMTTITRASQRAAAATPAAPTEAIGLPSAADPHASLEAIMELENGATIIEMLRRQRGSVV